MPVPYEVPSWIRPAGDIAEAYARGFQLGEQRRSEQARLAAAMQRAAMEASAQAQAQALRERMAQAELAAQAAERQGREELARERIQSEIEHQRRQADIALGQLELRRQLEQRKADVQARALADAIESARKLAAGEDPRKVIAEHPFAYGAGAGALSSPAQQVLLEKAWVPSPPITQTNPITGQPVVLWNVGPSRYSPLGTPEETLMEREERRELRQGIARAESELAKQRAMLPMLEKSPKTRQAVEAEIKRLEDQINRDRQALQSLTSRSPAAPPELLPAAPAQAPAVPDVQAPSPAPTAQTPSLQPVFSLEPGYSSVTAPPIAAEGVILRRKSDGKLLRYRGKPEDVPADRFEIVR